MKKCKYTMVRNHAAYDEEHAVMIVDFMSDPRDKVTICKMSKKVRTANDGYIVVSLQTMFTDKK
ncbi:unnamed protein product [Eruca vesicaria subsp. sativa]|uniref:Uncharacterized protein n=1 Tax=Eruca vesicaria subsp. sativa TaxID=29727 RepID=A0ABC8KHP6_ERUVS|nr:unnamed protein product [Eruca vesicaria subsp. sativa]